MAVVTVTYNSAALIEDALADVLACEPDEVVVIDNGSSDGCAERARRIVQDSVHEGANVGFGAGCNRGVAELRTPVDYVLFLNPDAGIDKLALGRLVNYLDTHPPVAIVGPRMMSDGIEIPSCGKVPTLATEIHPLLPRPLRRLLPSHVTAPGVAETGEVGFVEGACFLVRLSAFLEVGGFDERYFLFFEELDISNRLRSAGYQVHLVNEVIAQHARGASRAGVADGAQSHFWVSTWTYLRIWRGRWTADVWGATARLVWGLRVLLRLLDWETARMWSRELGRGADGYCHQPKLGFALGASAPGLA